MNQITKTLTIVNSKGLHARASAKLVELLEGFDSEVLVQRDSMQVTGRSIMGLLMLGACKGSQIELHIVGSDCMACFSAIQHLVNNGFGENNL